MDRHDAGEHRVMDQLLRELLCDSLESAGWLERNGASVSVHRERLASAPPFFARWFEESLRALQAGGLLLRQAEERFSAAGPWSSSSELWRRWEAEKAAWMNDRPQRARLALAQACLAALPDILSGRRDATEALFPDSSTELVAAVYRDNFVADFFNEALAEALFQLCEARRRAGAAEALKVLEVGAGTGATTEAVMSRLAAAGWTLGEYCFTDLSRAFLQAAQSRFSGRVGELRTRRFDVEQSPLSQGFDAAAYDFVIAANVLHATANIRGSLRNIKALLKPKGVLLINELSTKTLFNHLTFGLLEGWWRYEDDALRIPGSPLLSPSRWTSVLREEGFADVVQLATAQLDLGQQIFAAESDGFVRAAAEESNPAPPEAGPAPGSGTVKLDRARAAAEPAGSNRATGANAGVVQAEGAGASTGTVSTQMIEDYVTDQLNDAVADALKMPHGDLRAGSSFLDYGVDSLIAVKLINRINRALGLALQTTMLFDYSTIPHLARHIAAKYTTEIAARLGSPAARTPTSQPPALSAGKSGARAATVPAPGLQPPLQIPKRAHSAPASSQAGSGPGKCRRLILTGPTEVDALTLTEATVPALSPTQVCVSTRAFALNFADLLCVRGLYPALPEYPFTPGMDAAGVVVAIGDAVTSVAVGDEVITGIDAGLGAHATMLIVESAELFKKPAHLTFEEACVLNTSTMAVVAAFQRAGLRSGESILIQSATGGVGLTAIQMARYAGARVFATAGSQPKIEYLSGLGVDHPIHYLEADFETEVLRLTQGRGVDVVLNTLAGDAIQKGVNCLAPGGRYIELAAVGLKAAKALDLAALGDNKTFFTLNIRALHRHAPQQLRELHEEMLRLHEARAIAPSIGRVFDFNELQQAYAHLESRRSIGKIVIRVAESDWYAPEVAADRKAPQARGAQAAVPEPIAIVGMSGRFAQSRNLEEFWSHLAAGRSLIERASRWDLSASKAEIGSARFPYCDYGSFLDGIGEFDPLFFEISGAEARYMDPQQRLFLEECWKALEDAGYAGSASNELACGVYVGCATSHYETGLGAEQPAQAFWGNAQSIIPARIAYYLNLTGPAVAVDTACSSSLVSVHLACQALWAGEIRMALAGGVFVQCTTAFFDSCNRARMLSPGGRCFTFDARADGFVPGEGVGVIALKRLSDALADGDHVYAVIRGSGINQDGSTNGITAPSALAQERLEKSVYERFGIDPATLGLVEAHGTGTKLGDPIEITALTRAFTSYTARRNYCAIGSVKTNIGHAATAAGIAGLLKAVLALHRREIPPSINFATVNPAIDFDMSPFYVNTALKNWESADQPRRAAVSSFAFSGTNAHLVLEEAPPAERRRTDRPAYLIALSARTPDQLRQQAQRLLERYAQDSAAWHLSDVSLTLLAGRKHWNHRLACVVRSVAELRTVLSRWLEGKSASQLIVNALEGPVREQAALKRYGNHCIRDCARSQDEASYVENLSAVAELYAQGYDLELARLFDKSCRRISLPTYPFARDVYWVEPVPRVATVERLHPLVHRNTSTLEKQRFSSSLSVAEPVLGQHVVLSEPTLPAVAYLEMVIAALRYSTPASESRHVRLRNVIWLRPLRTRETVDLHIELAPQAGGGLEFAVCRYENDERTVHAQGQAEWFDAELPPEIDLDSVRDALHEQVVAAGACYEAFEAMHIEHGPWFRGIQTVLRGEHELLAELRLPDNAAATARDYFLHPALLDSALQAAVAFDSGTREPDQANLPFALRGLTVLAPCASTMWAVVHRADRDAPIDVRLCDSEGRVCVHFEALTSRRFSRDAASKGETVFAVPGWRPEEPSPGRAWEPVERHVVLVNLGAVDARQVAADLAAECVTVPFADDDWTRHYSACAQRFLEIVQRALASRSSPDASALIQVAVAGASAGRFAPSLTGLFQSLAIEHARVAGQVLLFEHAPDTQSLVQRLRENGREPLQLQVRYRSGRREIRAWQPFAPDESIARAARIAWRAQGIYLITGGLGGLGRAFAAEILRHAPQARVVLLGRSTPGPEQTAALEELQRLGAVSYRQTDVAHPDDTQRLINDVLHEHGALHGVIHAAGITRDSFLARKTSADLEAVLRPKVAGALCLDHATRTVELDFFLLCSSGAGLFGNVGQADYALANAWLDCFADWRNEAVNAWQRRGHTVSVLWPLWEAGGMTTDRETRAMLERRLGMVPLPAAAGLQALHVALRIEQSQLFVMHGHRQRMLDALARVNSLNPPPMMPRDVQAAVASAGAPARNTLQTELQAQAAAALGLPRDQVSVNDELSHLGFDSIMLTDFANRLSRRFGLELAPTLFFEYPTLAELSRHLLEAHGPHLTANGPNTPPAERTPEFASSQSTQQRSAEARCLRLTGSASDTPAVSGTPELASSRPTQQRSAEAGSLPLTGLAPDTPAASGTTDRAARLAESVPTDALAIVGMSGVFPMAENIDELWSNLLAGRDCISEVPAERWSWREIADRAGLDEAVRWGGFISGVDTFDPLFFKISPKEAELMDPQQRLMMMHLYHAIEDAGYSPQSLAGRNIGIFIGTGNTGYANLIEASDAALDTYSATGLIPSLGPNRMSFFLNLHGPSEPVETACSSSLVALHRARADILSGRCEAALVGGVNTLVTPESYVRYAKAGMLAPDGRCKTFSAQANGYVRGEGVGVLFLKRLDDARRSGDHVYAVIRGTAVNHGGRATSLTAPNAKAQARLLQRAYAECGVSMDSVGYIETHGTGTPLGDPVEINGLIAAFNECTTEPAGRSRTPCALGSIKTNIGHLELAAGVAGLVKVVLQLRHRVLVKSLHCDAPNPYIDLKDSPFFLLQENQDWRAPVDAQGKPLPRRAGVSSFGFGGTNAHAIVEEYSATPARSAAWAGRAAIVPLSARTTEQLRQIVRNLMQFLERHPDSDLHGLAYTLQVGRDAFEVRLGFVASSVAELRAQLAAVLTHAAPNAGASAAAESNELLAQWLRGEAVDWASIYGDTRPNRMSLPPYPFARQRFWIGGGRPGEPSQLQMFTPVWSPDPAALESAAHEERAGAVLLVGGTSEHLQAAEREWPRVHHLQLAPEESIDSLRERLRKVPQVAQIVWVGHGFAAPMCDLAALDEISAGQSAGVLRLFALVKALLALDYGERALEWSFITTGTHSVLAGERTNPTDCSLQGFVGSLVKEFPRWSARLIDLPAGQRWPEKNWQRLRPDADCAYALRNHRWFTQSLAPVHELPREAAPYRQGGVYVVIGGAGGLGALWSRYVIERYQAKVYWLGRRPRDESIASRSRELAQFGPEPTYLQADCTDRSQLEGAYEEIRARHAAIHGVIHAVVGDFDRGLVEYDAASFRDILAAKVDVAVTLARVFALEPLDFLLFFSSMAAFARSGGMSAYSAGCVFADGFAHWLRSSLALPAKTVNWGYWDVGSGERISESMKIRLRQSGIEPLEPEAALTVLERFLGSPLRQLLLWQGTAATTPAPVSHTEVVTVYANEIPSTLEALS